MQGIRMHSFNFLVQLPIWACSAIHVCMFDKEHFWDTDKYTHHPDHRNHNTALAGFQARSKGMQNVNIPRNNIAPHYVKAKQS